MNGGKTHTFFSWASINAWVPPVYNNATPHHFSYSNYTATPPSLATHDPELAWQDQITGRLKPYQDEDARTVMRHESEVNARWNAGELPGQLGYILAYMMGYV